MADYPYQGDEPKPKAPGDGWGKSSTFLLGLAIGAAIGLAATPVGRGALIPIQWLQALGDDGAKGPAHVLVAAKPKIAAVARPPAVKIATALPPPELRAPIAGQPLVVGVFGDSMADGLWAGLYRKLHTDAGGFEVVRFSQASTGLARYSYVDMQKKTQAALDSRHIDVAVLLTGTNDEQGIEDGGKVYEFASPGWRAVYERRINDLVTLLRSRGVAVYWIGLPKMERRKFDAGAVKVNGVLADRMTALGVPFIPTTPVTVNAQGEYDDYLPEPGARRPVLMRARDGIHMTMAGYLRIAEPVAERLRADVAAVSASSASSVRAVSLVTAAQTGARR